MNASIGQKTLLNEDCRGSPMDKEVLGTEEAFRKRIESERKSCGKSVVGFPFSRSRIRILSPGSEARGSVLYWMCRDQRVEDNWAFLYAQKLGLEKKAPLHCCFVLLDTFFLNAPFRHYDFMLRGLEECANTCTKLNIPFHLLRGDPRKEIVKFVKDREISAVVPDFSPLRSQKEWIEGVLSEISVYFAQVDAHNIVPCYIASEKQEVGARTIRPKIHKKLPYFLTEYPPIAPHPYSNNEKVVINWKEVIDTLSVDRSVKPLDWLTPGSDAGIHTLYSFLKYRLPVYARDRNDPSKDGLSGLSPWFHFGQISPQRAILEARRYGSGENLDAFFEEAVVRRELSDNFCYYNPLYDNIKGSSKWAQLTLQLHASDKREHIYDAESFEKGLTHDDLWNAAQLELVCKGKMHGYMRMYWAKKILEWSKSPKKALKIAVYLNDKYSIDGRDPNGYVGCMWSICGVHDRGWGERPIYGKIRCMTYEGTRKKFDIKKYISKYSKDV